MPQSEHTKLEDVLPETDVLYVTRVQKERFEDPAQYESVKDAFVITPEIMKQAKDQMIVMHPLPRVGEIAHGSGPRPAGRLLPPDGVRPVHPHGAAGHGARKGIENGTRRYAHDCRAFGEEQGVHGHISERRTRARIDSLLCVGLDPHPSLLPAPTAAAAKDFCLRLIQATADLALAFKPNSAFFEAFGAGGNGGPS